MPIGLHQKHYQAVLFSKYFSQCFGGGLYDESSLPHEPPRHLASGTTTTMSHKVRKLRSSQSSRWSWPRSWD